MRPICLHVNLEATEVFTIFDKDQDGSIMVEEIGAAFRSVGFNPTEKEIGDIQQELEKQGRIVSYMIRAEIQFMPQHSDLH